MRTARKGMSFWMVILGLAGFLVSGMVSRVPVVAADEGQTIVEVALKDKMRVTGKLDLYDEKLNKVRNLDLLTVKVVEEDGEGYLGYTEFRDIKTGDILTIAVSVVPDSDGWKVTKTTVTDMIERKQEVDDTPKKYTDEEIQAVMRDYVVSRSKFTETFDLYDEKKEAMRHLILGGFQPKVRRFGILNISSADFTDKDSGERLVLDFTVDSKKEIKVKSVKIKSIKK